MTSFKLFLKKNRSIVVTVFLLLGLGSAIACVPPIPNGGGQPVPLSR
jgi:hypothetical protein